jgi:hypothetical protein
VYDHAAFPADLKAEMYAWVRENAQEEKKASDTEQQFLYKARKKAIGPFKGQFWALPAEIRTAIGQSLEEQFVFLMEKLRIGNTADAVAKYVTPYQGTASKADVVAAAAGKITAAERKAEGLAD